MYVNYAMVDDFEKLREMNISVSGHIVIAKYGRIYRGDKVSHVKWGTLHRTSHGRLHEQPRAHHRVRTHDHSFRKLPRCCVLYSDTLVSCILLIFSLMYTVIWLPGFASPYGFSRQLIL